MNLQENIHRIHQMMGVISEDKKEHTIRTIIDKMGVANAIKMTGNYYMIEPYLKVVDKVNFIKEKVSQLSDDFGGNGFGLVEIDEAPIFYSEDEDELNQIEYLGRKQLYVDVYSSDSNSNIGDFKVQYESLPVEIIEQLVEILLNH
jgi:hypothetical protein